MDQPTDKVVPLPMTPESTTDKPSDEVTPPLPSSVPESIVDQALNQIFAQAQMPTQQDGVIDITDDKSDMYVPWIPGTSAYRMIYKLTPIGVSEAPS